MPGLRWIDGLLGAALTGCVALGVAWIVGAVALDASNSSSLRKEIRGSQILRELDRVLPPSGPVLNALERIDPLPSVRGPAATVAPPSRAILASPAVHRAGRSVVRVYGLACGLGVEGSGWVVAPGLVVTNAHVVAGERRTQIQVRGVGPDLAAEVVGFDVHNDIAVLRVPSLALPRLRFAQRSASGTAAAILGYPLDGAFNVQPGRLGQTESVHTQNAYGDGHVLRSITPLRGRIRPGNSGGPVIDSAGSRDGDRVRRDHRHRQARRVRDPEPARRRAGTRGPWPAAASGRDRTLRRVAVSPPASGGSGCARHGRAAVGQPPTHQRVLPPHADGPGPGRSSAICVTTSSSNAPISSGWCCARCS